MSAASIRNEMLSRNLDAVPYMTTLGGQTFADAYSKIYFPVAATSGTLTSAFVTAAQPFFESALGGANGAYCAGYANCTSAVAAKNAADIRNTSVSNLWTALYKAPGWALRRSMISAAAHRQHRQPGLHLHRNRRHRLRQLQRPVPDLPHPRFPRRLGNQQLHLGPRARHRHHLAGHQFQHRASMSTIWQNNYGPQSFDIKFLYNLGLYYTPKWSTPARRASSAACWAAGTSRRCSPRRAATPIAVTYTDSGSNDRAAGLRRGQHIVLGHHCLHHQRADADVPTPAA